MMGFGILSVIVASFSLLRGKRDIKRMFAYSSIEHMGITTFAFGLGGPVATFGALLHMLVPQPDEIRHLLYRRARVADAPVRRTWTKIQGLIRGNPLVGWGMTLGVMAIVGMPPFGVFMSEFLDPHAPPCANSPGRRRSCCSRWAWRSPSVFSTRAADGVRRYAPEAARPSAGAGTGVRASRARPDARALHSALPRPVVSRRQRA